MKVQRKIELKDFTSLRVGGPAKNLISLESGDDLAEVVRELDGPVHMLGYGTNCLVSDKGLSGTVILNKTGRLAMVSPTRITADSGANWDDLVRLAIEHKLWGLEFTSGIPGGVGAAVAGNIAAYGHKVADCFVEATVMDSQTLKTEHWHKDDFKFEYRSSAIQLPKHTDKIILAATFELDKEPNSELEYDSALAVAKEMGIHQFSLENRRKIIMETRRRAGSLLTKDESNHHSAGSFFKNPMVGEQQVEKILAFEEHGISREQLLRQNKIHGGQQTRVSAAHVLLAAGYHRGQTWGQVRLHPDHILKIENLGKAKAQDIYNVVQEIIETVKLKLDIELEPEVRFLGDF